MERLSELPNISNVLEEKLKEVGIYSVRELKKDGSKAAFVKLRIANDTACIQMLYALEGAVQNIRWHHLDIETKEELSDFYKSISYKYASQ